jgi:hypothetical protein
LKMKRNAFPLKLLAEHNPPQRIYLLVLCSLFFMAVGFITPMLANAQEEDGWTDPLNLSRSGAATNPQIVIDNQGVVHVMWEDEFAGWVYIRQDGEGWGGLSVVNFPFVSQGLKFATDGQGRLHAFWLNQDGALLHSRVSAANFGVSGSWSEPQVLASSAPAFKVVSDSRGDLHLAYIRPLQTSENPAGVYYRRTVGGGDSWTSSVSIYLSPYLRGLTPGNASVDIAAALVDEQLHIYLTWDNRPRKELYLIESQDGGQTWTEPRLVDRPDPQRGLATPFNLMAGALGEGRLLIWQVGEPGAFCRQYYQWSADNEDAWGEPLPMLAQFTSCPQDNKFIVSADGNLVLISTIMDNIYLSAWDGERWSEPQLQSILRGFEDQEVLSQVRLGCRQFTLSPNGRLYVVGCDEAGGGDIWITSRSLLDTESWLGAPPVWRSLETLAESSLGFSDPVLVSDHSGNIHAVWSQVDERTTALTDRSAIFYARWDGQRWSNPSAILSSAAEDYRSASAAYDNEGRLLLTWSGRDSGEVYFSWASTSQALRPDDWARFQVVPAIRPAASSPFIFSANGERIWIAYAIPVNEGRGVYLVESRDHGFTWSQPRLVFDAALAGWEMVDRPRLTQAGDGTLHAIFERYSLPGGRGSLGLYYSRSEDGGDTWSNANLVSESSLADSQIFSIGSQVLHRLWQEAGSGAVWHNYSTDNGARWSRAERIPALSGISGTPGAVIDRSGRLHVFAAVEQTGGDLVLQHWTREGAVWRAQESFSLGSSTTQLVTGISAAIDPQGQLGLLVHSSALEADTRLPLEKLTFSQRTIQIGEAPPLPTLSPEPTPTPTQTLTPGPAPTATIDPALLQDDPGNSRGQANDNQYLGVILGVGLASLLVAAGFGLVVVVRRGR